MKFFFRHISDEKLLFCSTGELSRDERGQAIKHLSTCAHCASRLRELTVLQEDLQILHQERYSTSSSGSLALLSGCKGQVRHPVWIRWTAGVVACSLVTFLVFFGNGFVASARATTILGRAAANETDGSVPPHLYQIHAGGDTCYLGGQQRRVHLGSSSCLQAEHLLSSAKWNTENPLSARSFESWRKSLKSHHDLVQSESAAVVVRTEASEGVLKAASLKLNTADYQPLEAKLEFSDETLVIEAKEMSTEPHLDELAEADRNPRATLTKVAINPLDVAETGAWQVLHAAEADNGWETSVVRQSDGVVVEGIVADYQRRSELLSSLKSVPGLNVDIEIYSNARSELQSLLPVRLPRGAGQPLAQDWLSEHFPDDEERSKFRNDVREMSRLVLGRAHALDQLKHSADDLRTCAECKAKVLSLIGLEQSALHEQLFHLATTIAPFFSLSPNPVNTIGYTDAQKLDQALGALFSGTSDVTVEPPPEKIFVERLLFRHS